MKKKILYSILAALVLSTSAQAASVDDLERRVKALESETQVTREESADLSANIENGMRVAGYADVEYIASNALKSVSQSGFRVHHLSLMFKKKVTDSLRFFSEIEYEDAPFAQSSTPSVTGKMFVEALNFDYMLSQETSLRVGRFFTPAGVWSVDHYPPFVATQDRPQHIRKIFPQVFDGAMATGNHAIGETHASYDLYVGNGETSNFDGSTDNNTSMAHGLRVNFAFPLASTFDVGATIYRDRMKLSSTDADQAKKQAMGLHARVKHGAIGFQGEYADGRYTPTAGASVGVDYHRKGYYGQVSYDVTSKTTLGYRYDFYDPKSTAALDNVKINSLIANYHVNKDVVLKWEHHLINPENPASANYYRSIAGLVVNF